MINDEIFKKIFRENIKFNEPLASYTTYKIGGPARYFVMAKNKDILVKAINFAKEKNLPYFILGGGSNILVSDSGFIGMIIKIDMRKIAINKKKKQIIADAGASLSEIIQKAVSKGLTGMEFAYGLPGTLGGAIRGNAGCFGKEINQFVQSVEVLRKGEIKIFSSPQCQFDYRQSIFKKDKDLIILSALLKLQEGNSRQAKKLMQKHLSYRKEKHPLDYPSAGCVFKNPPGAFAGILIDQAGLKGKTIGGAQISEKHSNFIINKGGAKAKDVYQLMKLAQGEVYKKFKIRLEPEIQLLGEFE